MTSPEMTEAVWQEQFVQLAHLHGWRHMFVRRSRGKGGGWTTATNVPGWPDLHLWNERQQRTIYVELKSAAGETSPDQDAVIASLRNAGQDVYVLRPDDLELARRILSTPAAEEPR